LTHTVYAVARKNLQTRLHSDNAHYIRVTCAYVTDKGLTYVYVT